MRARLLGLIVVLIVAGFAADYAVGFLANRQGAPGYTPKGLGAIEEHAGGAEPNLDTRYQQDGKHKTGSPPPAFRVQGMPVVLDQGSTPQCVAFAASTLKAWEDLRDQGAFNFSELTFFNRIGGTQDGAYIRDAFSEMRSTGYPVVSVDQSAQHKIASYWTVNPTVANLKAALVDYGPLDVISPWYHSWYYPRSGVFQAPDYVVGGHSFIIYGYDDSKAAWLVRNSWGTDWGLAGDAWLPYAYTGNIWSWWSATDVIENPNTYSLDIRPYPELREWNVAAGTILRGYDPARPGSAVYITTYPNPSSAHTDAEVYVTWSQTRLIPDGGPYLRVTDGAYAGLLIVKADVTLTPLPVPTPTPTPATPTPVPASPTATPTEQPSASPEPAASPTAPPTSSPAVTPVIVGPTPVPNVIPTPVTPSGPGVSWWAIALALLLVSIIGTRRSR